MIPLTDEVPVERPPIINWMIIILNVVAFLFELSLGDHIQGFIHHWAVVPARLLHGLSAHEVETIFAGMFLHGGWLHLIGNMWALFIFGDNVEDRMGHGKYLLFYLLCGVAAAFGQAWSSPSAHVPSIGASGAIAGVMAAYLVFYPHARVRTFAGIFILMLPAWFVVGEWIVVQLINGFTIAHLHTQTSGIAWFAHVGGFIAGLILARFFEDRSHDFPYVPTGVRPFERSRF